MHSTDNAASRGRRTATVLPALVAVLFGVLGSGFSGAAQAQASGLGRALGYNDALIAHSAMQEGIPLITGDQQLLCFLGEIGYPAEGF